MADTIKLKIGDKEFLAELYDNPTVDRIKDMLPMELTMSRWGDEYYGDCGIDVPLSPDARDVMEVGEIAVWPVGNALCIFFGPTPASTGNEPRAASRVNPVGRLVDDPAPLKRLGSTVKANIDFA